jgi:hypothetical protein
MKHCPTCNQDYDDSSAFCARDATPLISVGAPPAGPAPGAPKQKSKALRYSMIGCGALFLVGLASCGVLILIASKPDPEGKKRVEEQNRQDMAMVIERLLRLRANCPEPATLKEAACSDDEIGKMTEYVGGQENYLKQVLYIDFDFLEQFTNPAADPDGDALRNWQFMTSKYLRDFRPMEKLKLSLTASETSNLMYEQRKYKRFAVLLRASRRQLPTVSQKADTFVPGFFDGWAVVFDYQSGQRLCQTPLQFESGEAVKYKRGSRFFTSAADRENMTKAIQEDFKIQFKEGAKKALARVSGKLEIFGYGD